MVTELHDVVAGLAAASAVRVVILTGSGRWFSPGGDVKAFENGEFAAEVEQGYDPRSWRIPELLHGMPQITIAAVNGLCAGAAVRWACACDIRGAALSRRIADGALSAEGAGLARRLTRYDGQALQRLKQHYLLAETSTLPELS